MAKTLGEWAEAGWLNIVGGCCGTTPDHIAALVKAVEDKTPRSIPQIQALSNYAGLEPLVVREDMNFINIGERTNQMQFRILSEPFGGMESRSLAISSGYRLQAFLPDRQQ